MLQHTGGLHYEPFVDRVRLTDDVSVNYIAQLTPAGNAT
jgi:2-polyprenyl-3-methyl-5-hydroxy-6-metoxy-1,4-benzoquinol methylase